MENNINKNKENISNATNPQKNTKKDTYLFIGFIFIIGFFLFSFILEKEKEKTNELLIYNYEENEELYNNDESYRGIEIFDVQNIYLDGNGLLIVDIYNNRTNKSIHPDEIKKVTDGVTWVGQTKKAGILNYYTLYVVGDKYDAVIALKNYQINEELK